jgi:hypothetical protein
MLQLQEHCTVVHTLQGSYIGVAHSLCEDRCQTLIYMRTKSGRGDDLMPDREACFTFNFICPCAKMPIPMDFTA